MTRTITLAAVTARSCSRSPPPHPPARFSGTTRAATPPASKSSTTTPQTPARASLNGCWRTARHRITCDYKTWRVGHRRRQHHVCTGRVHAIRDRYIGVYVTEQASYYDCKWKPDPNDPDYWD